MCEHGKTSDLYNRPMPFRSCVASAGVTECDGRAHGNVSGVEVCRECGAERDYNSNAGVVEYSAWSEGIPLPRENGYLLERKDGSIDGLGDEVLFASEAAAWAAAETAFGSDPASEAGGVRSWLRVVERTS